MFEVGKLLKRFLRKMCERKCNFCFSYLHSLPELLVDIYESLGQPLPGQLAKYSSADSYGNDGDDQMLNSSLGMIDSISDQSYTSRSWGSQPRSMPTTR